MINYKEKTQEMLNKISDDVIYPRNKLRITESNYLSKLFYIVYKNRFKKFYARVISVSKSGMSRKITFSMITNRGEYFKLNLFINVVLNNAQNVDYVLSRGLGTDLIFDTLHTLATVLHYKHGRKKQLKIYEELVRKANNYSSL